MDTREPLERFLIVCEGERTEPHYFECFRVPTRPNVVPYVVGTGYNTVALVQEALKLRQEAIVEKKEYDQVWCVFDRDSFPPEQFNAALILAANEGLQVAYSNEAFELWYLLHFNYYDTGISRQSYCDRLSSLLNHPYAKKSATVYAELEAHQGIAMRHARRLLSQYDPPEPVRDNPSTTVHLLVEQLLRFTR